ncbi:MAG: STAS-like domain-containing protein [Vulcanimicrobiota bacterium]
MVCVKVKNLVGAEVIIGRDTMNTIVPIVSKAAGSPVILDFEGIESISSPFAHSLINHVDTHISVTIQNASPHVNRMLDVVKARTRVAGSSKIKRTGRVVIKAGRRPGALIERYINAAH